MGEEPLAKTASKYLGELKKLAQWAVGIALVATVLAIQGKHPLKVLELELSRDEAFYLLSFIYCGICAAVLAYVVRLSQLVGSVPAELLEAVLDRLARHESLVNPFASYSFPSPKRPRRYWGFVLLIVIFWLGVSSLYALIAANHLPIVDLLRYGSIVVPTDEVGPTNGVDQSFWQVSKAFLRAFVPLVPLGVFMVLGYCVMDEVISIPKDAAQRFPESDLRARLTKMTKDLKYAADIGIAVGGGLLVTVLLLGALSYLWKP